MVKERLANLRAQLRKSEYQGYIVPCGDEYMSEYTPPHAKRLEYITGFTGSNGLAIILEDRVLFFTDGRYLEQSKTQLDSDFEIYDQHMLQDSKTFADIPNSALIAYDSKLFSKHQLRLFKDLKLVADDENLIDLIWSDQPAKPDSKIYEYASEYAGADRLDKISRLQKFLQEHKAGSFFISDPASVCWLLNIRANDVAFTPILLAYALVTQEKIFVFMSHDRPVPDLEENISFHNNSELTQILKRSGGKILFDKNQTTLFYQKLLEKMGGSHQTNPCMLWKACKNGQEIYHAKEGHIEDAVAVCQMLCFLESNDLSTLSEYDIGSMLTGFRSRRKNYVSDSFDAICGFQSNGAIIHYKAKEKTAKKLQGSGLLLIDSGGQYLGTTTDITRTISIGKATKEHKEYYTRVLKGHIALAEAKFPKDRVSGVHLDVLARQYLWEIGKDYAHGTGHGVGNFLSVHEGPQNIGLGLINTPLKPGMILSNEPGYYVNGQFGIRIENLMYVKELEDGFLGFEMLTLVPYSKELINFDMLNDHEKTFLANYNQKIKDKVLPRLSGAERVWLQDQL